MFSCGSISYKNKNVIKLSKCKQSSNKDGIGLSVWMWILIWYVNFRGEEVLEQVLEQVLEEVLEEVLALRGLLVEYVAPLWTNIRQDAF